MRNSTNSSSTARRSTSVFQSVGRHDGTKETVPPGFEVEIGRVVPKSITLQRLPSDATNRVWAVKSCDYAMLQNQLLIVNPQDRKVADIHQDDLANERNGVIRGKHQTVDVRMVRVVVD